MTPQVHLNHNVYILGAGFSVDAGIPVTNNFLHRMRDSLDWLNEQRRDEERKAVEKVFDFRLKAAGAAYRTSIDVENIEELFSLASASENDSSQSVITGDAISTAIAATLDYSQQRVAKKPTCTIHIPNKPVAQYPKSWAPKGSAVRNDLNLVTVEASLYQVYAGILSGHYCEKSADQKNTIITFNYDTLLEDAFHEQDFKFTYGIESSGDKDINFDPSAKCVTHNDKEALSILKLHGSVNWGKGKGRGKQKVLTVFGDYSDVRKADSYPVLILLHGGRFSVEH